MRLNNSSSLSRPIMVAAFSVFLSACGGGAATDSGSVNSQVEIGNNTTESPITNTNNSAAPSGALPENTESAPEQNTPTENAETDAEIPAPTPLPEEDVQAEPEPEPLPETESEPLPDTEPEPEPELDPPPVTETVPVNVSCSATQDDIRLSVISLFNEARAVARQCGNQSFEAAGPLNWNDLLKDAAQAHSTDMATHNFFSHTGSDGLSVAMRVSNVQYDWRTVGENIAAGQLTTEDVVNAWLESPGHCANIMNPDFQDTAVTCVQNEGTDYERYWTHVIGTEF